MLPIQNFSQSYIVLKLLLRHHIFNQEQTVHFVKGAHVIIISNDCIFYNTDYVMM